jgi:thiamine-monophosphate kinase
LPLDAQLGSSDSTDKRSLMDVCLFCNPGLHNQAEQVLLRSTNFYLFAGLGPIAEGYIIITPHRCDLPEAPKPALADLTPDQLDELIFLRGLVSDFYRITYGQPGMHFEHGRSGVCLVGKETKHCYHAHLCCYPVSYRIWEDMSALNIVDVQGIGDIADAVGQKPYLFMQACEINLAFPVDAVAREKWIGRIAILDAADQIESQYLRRKLALRVDSQNPHLWQWDLWPQMQRVNRLIDAFRKWLPTSRRYVWTAEARDGVPFLDFHRSVVRANECGNDYVAQSFFDVWRGHEMYNALGRFLSRLPSADCLKLTAASLTAFREAKIPDKLLDRLLPILECELRGPDAHWVMERALGAGVSGLHRDLILAKARQERRPRVLDAGCGPGLYTRALYDLGIECVAIDVSEGMLEIARHQFENLPDRSVRDPVPLPTFLKMDATALALPDASFDGIWYSAIFVHVPPAQGLTAIKSLRRLLRDDGILYFSAQTGGDSLVRYEGRVFYFYSEKQLLEMFREAGFTVVEQWDDTANRGACGDTRAKFWKNYLLSPQPRGPRLQVLSDLGERGVLQHLAKLIPKEDHTGVALGIGDDCAAIRANAGETIVVTTDPCPQPVISMLGEPDRWYDGWFSVAINVSDLGAMGARPLGILLAIEAPEGMPVAELDRFYAGALEASRIYECPVIGGNLKDAARFNCVGSAFGAVREDRMLRRGAARAGELVVVLGHMGRFWSGVLHRMMALELTPDEIELVMEPMRKPTARIREGRALADRSISRCAMDSSDGLIACFYELARCGSGIDLHIDLSNVVPDPVVDRVARAAEIDIRKLLLAWGDWQLVCTIAEGDLDSVHAMMSDLGCPVWVVGRVREGAGQVWLQDAGRQYRMAYLASERFTRQSYFSHGLSACLRAFRDQPLVIASEPR